MLLSVLNCQVTTLGWFLLLFYLPSFHSFICGGLFLAYDMIWVDNNPVWQPQKWPKCLFIFFYTFLSCWIIESKVVSLMYAWTFVYGGILSSRECKEKNKRLAQSQWTTGSSKRQPLHTSVAANKQCWEHEHGLHDMCPYEIRQEIILHIHLCIIWIWNVVFPLTIAATWGSGWGEQRCLDQVLNLCWKSSWNLALVPCCS